MNYKMKITAPLEHMEAMQMIIKQNTDLFPEMDTDLGKISAAEICFDTGSHPPISLRHCYMPFFHKTNHEQSN